MLALAGLTHVRPPFGFESIAVNGRDVEVHEEIAMQTPFCSLVHFRKGVDLVQPRVLLVAPLSGHFATLCGNGAHLLASHDVYITDGTTCATCRCGCERSTWTITSIM